MNNLPPVLRAYFDAKNRQDVDGMIATFAADATVQDEGNEYRGLGAIRSWIVETTRKYRVTAQPIGIEPQHGALVVSSTVSGSFPGSPATLRYRFTLAGDRITALAVG